MIHHILVHLSSSELVIHSPVTPHLTYVSSSSVKLNVVAAIGVDGYFGGEVAKIISACTPTSFVIGGHGRMLTTTGWLIVKRGGKSYQIEKLHIFCKCL